MATRFTREALRISWLSIAWSVLNGSVAIALGLAARSLALVGAGAILLIDLTSSAFLVWRFRQHEDHPTAERRAHRIAMAALFALALGLVLSATSRLVRGGAPHPGAIAIVASCIATLVLPLLGARKYRVARRVRSGALRADAHITSVGAMTNLISLLGLVFTRAGWGRADAIAALVVGLVAALVGVWELTAVKRAAPPSRVSELGEDVRREQP